MQFLLPLLITSSAVHAWEVSFYIGSDCFGDKLSSFSYPHGSACKQPGKWTTNFQSIFMQHDSPHDKDYDVALYHTDDCTGETLGVISDNKVCYPDRNERVKSYKVQRIHRKRDSKHRTPVEVSNDVEAWLDRHGASLAARSAETNLDLHLAPAKTYPMVTNISEISPHTDLDKFHSYLAASFRDLTVSSLSFTSLVSGCIGVGGAEPIPQLSCSTALAATCISFLSSTWHAYQGLRSIRATLRNHNIELGIRGIARRSDNDTMTLSQEEYMGFLLHKAGLNGTHIGYHDRKSTNTTSPAFHFHGEEGQQFVWTISPFETGDIRHTFSFHHDTKIEKRQGYQGVEVAGGLDVEACQRKAGTYSDLPTSASSAYEYYVKDLRCLVESSDLSKNYLNADVFDKSGYTVLTVGMSPYRGSSPDEVSRRPACSNDNFHFDGNCIF